MSVIFASVAECDKPDNAFWGDVVFYMYVESGDAKGKRVTLGRVNCDFKKRFEVVAEFNITWSFKAKNVRDFAS